MPIHAAGRYSRSHQSESLSDYTISSYTTTLMALILARSRAQKLSPRLHPRVLVVAQPLRKHHFGCIPSTIGRTVTALRMRRRQHSFISGYELDQRAHNAQNLRYDLYCDNQVYQYHAHSSALRMRMGVDVRQPHTMHMNIGRTVDQRKMRCRHSGC